MVCFVRNDQFNGRYERAALRNGPPRVDLTGPQSGGSMMPSPTPMGSADEDFLQPEIYRNITNGYRLHAGSPYQCPRQSRLQVHSRVGDMEKWTPLRLRARLVVTHNH
jgi:hypothetical protein